MAICASLMVNYTFRVSMEKIVAEAAHQFILLSDGMGFDLHFIRFFYWTLLPDSDSAQDNTAYVSDLCLLALIIIPMYVMAFDFLLSPINYFYDGRLNALCVPLAFLPMFLF